MSVCKATCLTTCPVSTTPPRGSSASAFDSATTISQGQDRERDLFLVTSEMWRSVSPVPALEMERLMKDGIR